MKQVIVIDAKNLCYRHGWSMQSLQSKGRPTGMLYGTISALCRLARLHPGAAFIFCWDGEKKDETWRHKLCKEYKANRKGKSNNAQDFAKKLFAQIPILMKFLEGLGFQQIKLDSVEADDLIGIVATHIKGFVDKVIIYSSDRDFYQLIDANVVVVPDRKKELKCRPISAKEIKKEYGVSPRHWLKYRALVGDKGDNILKNFGKKKVGPKTAVKLVKAGMDASRSKCTVEDYKPYWKTIRLNYKLSKILRTADAKELDVKTQKKLQDILRKYKCFDDVCRTDIGKSSVMYKVMCNFFAELEMEELMARRKEIWSIN